MRAPGVAVAAVLLAAAVGCGAPSGEPSSPPGPIARIHKAKCGACHVRVEPGERTRAKLEAAFPRHRKRVRLTEEQWGEMVDYLAAPQDATADASP